MNLDENILVPLYYQLKQIIKGKILSEEWKIDECIPSEADLCSQYQISRGTVRQAVMELVREGMLYRKQGKGTFIKDNKELQKAGNFIKGKTIGLVIPYMRQGGPDIVLGVENIAHSWGYHLTISNTNSSVAEEKTRIEWLVESGIKGLIIYTLQHRDDYESLAKMKEAHFPFVLIDRYLRNFETDYVVSDNYKGGHEATEHLINLGHKRIAFISPPALGLTSIGDRFSGYKRALEEHNINFDPGLVFICQSRIGVKYSKFGESKYFTQIKGNIAQALLDAANPPSAAFVAHDFLTMELYEHCKHVGLKVGKDIAVVSFDDAEIAAHLEVPLTSVRQSFYDMGVITAEILIDKLERRNEELKNIVLPVKLMVRQSCRTMKESKF